MTKKNSQPGRKSLEQGFHVKNIDTPLYNLLNKLKKLSGNEIGSYFLSEEKDMFNFEFKYRKIVYGKKEGLMIILRDVQLLQKLNKAIAEEKYKRLIIATISHEFRTPITSIIGGVGLAFDEVTEEGRAYLECVRGSAQSLELFIEDVVDYTKLSEGTFQLSEAWFQIRRTLDFIINLLKCKITQKNLNIQLVVSQTIPK
jgi:signal transduction histidine kinase